MLMTELESVSETLMYFNHMTWLLAQNFTEANGIHTDKYNAQPAKQHKHFTTIMQCTGDKT
jgi:hypothetical protein